MVEKALRIGKVESDRHKEIDGDRIRERPSKFCIPFSMPSPLAFEPKEGLVFPHSTSDSINSLRKWHMRPNWIL